MRAEHFADGYEKYYEYDEQDDLVKEWDNEQAYSTRPYAFFTATRLPNISYS